MKQTNACTIIIPTHNRPKYLRRILSYYDKYGGGYKIVVADSSSDENKKRNKKIISSFSNLNMLYLNSYPSEIHPYRKTADAVDYVDTKYCVFCADDDFLTPNGINQSVDFLEKNPDFAIAQGYNIPFWLEINKEDKPVFCWTPIHLCGSITLSDAESRLFLNFSESPFATFYCVHKTNFLKMIFKETIKFTEDVWFGELLLDMLTAVYGKMQRLDVLYSARDAGSISGKWPKIRDLKKEGTYDKRYARFKECLATHLSKNSQLSIEESKDLIDKAMSNHIKKAYGPKRGLMRKLGHTLKYLNLPNWIEWRIRAIYVRLFSAEYMNNPPSYSDKSSKYYDDFNKIRHHVLLYPEVYKLN